MNYEQYFCGQNVKLEQVFGGTQLINIDCYGHRNMS
jgi:hypothetical protein